MPDKEVNPPAPRSRLPDLATLMRIALIGIVMLAMLVVFGWVAGWFSPNRLTQAKLMSAFEGIAGIQPGFRHNHAKGVCVSGWFEGNGDGAAISSARVFQIGHVPVIGRFALAGGMPFQPDAKGTVRSMALQFLLPGSAEWRTGMNNIPVFPVNTPEAFYEQLLAGKPDPATGKPDPAAMQSFLASHPETVRAGAILKARQVTAGFSDSTFNSLDAFYFVDANAKRVPVRWSTVPELTTNGPMADAPADGKDALFDALVSHIKAQPLQWHLILTVGAKEDPTDDATLPWPADRQHIDAGLITINAVTSENGGGECTDINFDPLVLPVGIEPSDDPLLGARSSAYAASAALRAEQSKKKAPSAVAVNHD